MRFVSMLLLLLLLGACTPTPRKVSEAIGRGEIQTAVNLMTEMLNKGTAVSEDKLENLLGALAASHRFNLNIADDLFDKLSPEARPAVLSWYSGQYLERSEKALEARKFDEARQIWGRYQKIRSTYFPELKEPTPVLGIIDLREADFYVVRKDWSKAQKAFAAARQKLTSKRPFDRVKQDSFKILVDDVQRALAQKPAAAKGK